MASAHQILARELGADICRYLDFIKDNYGLHITLHHIEGAALESWPQLLSYNYHDCALCMEIKSSAKAWQHCVERQNKVKEKAASGAYIGTCYAGVTEWIFPLNDLNGETVGFMCVSGYTINAEMSAERASAAAFRYSLSKTKMKIAATKLSPEIPDGKTLGSLLQPIQSMFKTLFYLNSTAEATQHITNADRERLYSDMMNYINHNYRNPDFSLKDVSKRFSISYAHASRLFSEFSNVSFSRYIRTMRIETAKRYMEHTMIPIVFAASECGFSDSNYFSAVFKADIGISPREYRRRTNPACQSKTEIKALHKGGTDNVSSDCDDKN